MALMDLGNNSAAVVFGVLGNIVSFLVFFAPVPTFIKIYKEKSTMGFDSLPYLVSLFSAMLWMYYALIKTNALLLISINSVGCLFQTIYIFMYFYYAPRKAKIRTAMIFCGMDVVLFVSIFLFTFYTYKHTLRIQIVGWICVAVSVCVFAAPLGNVVRVVRTRSVEFMPLPLSFFLTLSAIMWFGYGLSQRDLCIAIPNTLGFALGLIQMVLYVIYKNAKKLVEEMKQAEQVINMVVVGNLEAEVLHQVHPENGEEKKTDKNIKVEEVAISVEPSVQVNLPTGQPELIVIAA